MMLYVSSHNMVLLLLGAFATFKRGTPLMLGTFLSCFEGKSSGEGIQGSICLDLGGIKVEFFTPHEPRLLTLLHDSSKEASKYLKTITRACTCQAGMIR